MSSVLCWIKTNCLETSTNPTKVWFLTILIASWFLSSSTLLRNFCIELRLTLLLLIFSTGVRIDWECFIDERGDSESSTVRLTGVEEGVCLEVDVWTGVDDCVGAGDWVCAIGIKESSVLVIPSVRIWDFGGGLTKLVRKLALDSWATGLDFGRYVCTS